MNQEIHLDQPGQTFVHELHGRPAGSIAVVVETVDGVVEDATIGTCAIEHVESELADVAPIGSLSVPLTTVAGVAPGRRYMIADRDGGRDIVMAADVRGDRVYLQRRLFRAFGAGSSFRRFQLSIAVNPAWQRDQARRIELGGVGLAAYRVRWKYELDGVATGGVDHVDLVFTPRHVIATPDDIERRFPGWLEQLPSAHRTSRGANVIEEAHDLVRRDAACAKVALNNAAETRDLVELRAKLVAMEHGVIYGKSPPAELDAAETRYRQRATALWAKLKGLPPVSRAPETSSGAVVDELRRWLHTSQTKISQYRQLQVLRQEWLPRLQTPGDCFYAARLIQQYITSRKLHVLREALLRELT